MTEVGRLLRYAVPGGIFELLVGLWLLLDASGLPRAASDAPSGRAVAVSLAALDFPLGYAVAMAPLLIAAAFPLGYLVSVIANLVAWLLHRCCSDTRVWGRIDTECVLGLADQDRLEGVCDEMPQGQEADEAFAEVALRAAHEGRAYEAAVERVRSLADQMNSLINSFTAVALAWAACTGVYGLTMALDENAARDGRWVVAFVVVSAALILVAGRASLRARGDASSVAMAVTLALLAWTGVFMLFAVLARDAVDDSWRLLTYLAYTAAAFALLFVISDAEARVARITEAFAVAMMMRTWRNDE